MIAMNFKLLRMLVMPSLIPYLSMISQILIASMTWRPHPSSNESSHLDQSTLKKAINLCLALEKKTKLQDQGAVIYVSYWKEHKQFGKISKPHPQSLTNNSNPASKKKNAGSQTPWNLNQWNKNQNRKTKQWLVLGMFFKTEAVWCRNQAMIDS